MELDGIIIESTEDFKLSVKEGFGEIRKMAFDALDHLKRFVAGGTLMTLLLLVSYQQTVGDSPWVKMSPQELVIDNSLHQPEVFSTDYYYQYDYFTHKIEQLGKLQDGWDGYGALAPTPKSLESTSAIVKALPKLMLMHCALFPANDAGVFLQGRFQNGKLSLYVHEDRMTYLAKSAEVRREGQKIVVNSDSTALLSSIISELFA